jgi:hypothetical protein
MLSLRWTGLELSPCGWPVRRASLAARGTTPVVAGELVAGPGGLAGGAHPRRVIPGLLVVRLVQTSSPDPARRPSATHLAGLATRHDTWASPGMATKEGGHPPGSPGGTKPRRPFVRGGASCRRSQNIRATNGPHRTTTSLAWPMSLANGLLRAIQRRSALQVGGRTLQVAANGPDWATTMVLGPPTPFPGPSPHGGLVGRAAPFHVKQDPGRPGALGRRATQSAQVPRSCGPWALRRQSQSRGVGRPALRRQQVPRSCRPGASARSTSRGVVGLRAHGPPGAGPPGLRRSGAPGQHVRRVAIVTAIAEPAMPAIPACGSAKPAAAPPATPRPHSARGVVGGALAWIRNLCRFDAASGLKLAKVHPCQARP